MSLALICAGLLAATRAADPPHPAREYQEARARAGKSSPEQVRLALWCEAHGLTRERLNHLAQAVLSDPANATARGLMGMVAYDGRFQRPEAVAEKAQADPILAQYNEKRVKAPYTAEGQWAIGVWAYEHGLKDQARAHLTAVTRLDPSRENAWRRLGYRKHDGRWITEAQVAAEKADAEAQRQADRKWKPLLEKYKAMLNQPSKRVEAEGALAAITEPRAVPSIGRVFGSSEATQPQAVQLLGQVDSAAASKGLAAMAAFARSAAARRVAAETLRGRDAREYADLLIALIDEPIKYEVRPVGGPGSPGMLFVEGKKADLKRIYAPPPAFRPGDTLKIDPSGIPVVDRPLGFFETDRPNVTGHSMYFVSGLGSSDRYGSWATGSGAGPLGDGTQSLGWSPGRMAASGATSTPAVDVAAWQAAIRGGQPPVVPRPNHAAGHQAGPSPSASSALSLGGPNAFMNLLDSPYIRVQDDGYFPLAQVLEEAQKSAMVAQGQLKADAASIERVNSAIRDRNDRVVGVLNQATGQRLAPDRSTWTRWWVDQLGYAFVTPDSRDKPTIVEDVPLAYQPQLTPINVSTSVVQFRRQSCFGRGTLVRTLAGPRPIESLRVGDRVLTQSTATGALGYQSVLVVHHNPPSPTFLIRVAGDTIVSSPFHRFWEAGRGWTMARDLRAGDRLRVLDGVAEVAAVEEGQVQPVFNLDVAGDADFFAGKAAALVHDNTLPDPRLAPFDAAPAAIARRGE